jgi:hypothetical protein
MSPLIKLFGNLGRKTAQKTSINADDVLKQMVDIPIGGTFTKTGQRYAPDSNIFVGGYKKIGYDNIDPDNLAVAKKYITKIADNPQTENIGYWINSNGRLALDNSTVTKSPTKAMLQMLNPRRIPQESMWVDDLRKVVAMRPGNTYFPMQQPRVGGYGINPETGAKYPLYEPYRRARNAAVGTATGLGSAAGLYGLYDYLSD